MGTLVRLHDQRHFALQDTLLHVLSTNEVTQHLVPVSSPPQSPRCLPTPNLEFTSSSISPPASERGLLFYGNRLEFHGKSLYIYSRYRSSKRQELVEKITIHVYTHAQDGARIFRLLLSISEYEIRIIYFWFSYNRPFIVLVIAVA